MAVSVHVNPLVDFRSEAMDFARLWDAVPLQSVAQSRTSDVCVIAIPSGEGEAEATCYRKRYWYPGFGSRWKGFFRNTFFGPSRAGAEFKNLKLLHDMGLSQVAPLAFGEERSFRMLSRAFILTSRVPGTQPLHRLVAAPFFVRSPLAERRSLLCALGRWLSKLHRSGYKDRDLFARNILVHPGSSPSRFSKIDAAAASGPCDGKDLAPPYIKDLKDLDGDLRRSISRTDRLRCLLAYLGAGEVDGEVRRLADRVRGPRPAR